MSEPRKRAGKRAAPASKQRPRKGRGAGDLPTTTQDQSVTVRLPGGIVDRIKALVPAVANDPVVLATRGGGSGVGLSAVLRLALIEGLTVLEARFRRG